MTNPLLYGNPVLLDRAKHRGVRVRSSDSFGFAGKATSLFLAASEFTEACKEYAVVFTRVHEQEVVPVVVLGLRNNENLFVDEDGRWAASYIPAFVRRYPFVLARLPGGQMGVCIDEAYPGFGAGEGEALFDDKGANTPFLQNALEFLERFEAEYERTRAFCRKVEELGLLTEMSARADLTDGRSFTVQGLMTVDEARLLQLPDERALSLFRSGQMHLLSMHLLSLSNMRRLVDRVAKRQAAMQAAPKPA
jgi:hypothetical protein